jgi:malonyl-CoA decarboxylase
MNGPKRRRAMLDGLREAAKRVVDDHTLRGLLTDCNRLLSERGEANSASIARDLVSRFNRLPDDQRGIFFERLAVDFSPDPKAVLQSAQAYASNPNAANLVRLGQLAEPPRQELLRRINRLPGGTASIVAMRHALLPRLARQPELQAPRGRFPAPALELVQPGLLELQRVDWNSPAQLLEQIIRHESVHAIDGWDDLRRRLQPDRRCFAFFHPQLPGEPLIFVEVRAAAGDAAGDRAADRQEGDAVASRARSRSRRSIRSAIASPACAGSRSATS